MKRLNERELLAVKIMASNYGGGAKDRYSVAAADALAYRRALKKCLSLSEYGNGVTLDMCLRAMVATIKRVLAQPEAGR